MKTLKQLALIAISNLVLVPGAYPQGTVLFNNLANTDAAPAATSNGLVFLAPIMDTRDAVLINGDLNFELWGGPVGQPLQPIHTWLLSDGSAQGIAAGGGHFADPSAGVYTIPGVAAGAWAALEVDAWLGDYDSLVAAAQAGAPFGRTPGTFTNPTGGDGAPASSLVEMPALVVYYVPEPSTLTLAAATATLLLWRRRKP